MRLSPMTASASDATAGGGGTWVELRTRLDGFSGMEACEWPRWGGGGIRSRGGDVIVWWGREDRAGASGGSVS